MRTWRRLGGFTVGLVAIATAGLIVRTLLMESRQPVVPPAATLPIDVARAAERLGRSVTIRTVSHEEVERIDREAFRRLHRFLGEEFPRVHERLVRTVMNELSLIYTWPGDDPELPPILLTAHMDVVPADDTQWEHPPFAGVVDERYVWGRGTMDDKVGVMALLEAAEYLLSTAFTPRRTVVFAFGHDEEIEGREGAAVISAHFQTQGVRFEFVLDEGMPIVKGIIPGIEPPAALVGIAEKGYANVEFRVDTPGGHASIPPSETAIGILARAVARLEANPMPPRLEGPVQLMFRWVAPEMPLVGRLVLGNLWLFGPIVRGRLAERPPSNASIRTTAAPTMLEGSDSANVLARRAAAVINYRLLPGDSLEAVLAHARRVIEDPRVAVRVRPGEHSEASPVSRVDALGFRRIAQSVRAVFPEAVVAPSLMIAATDARHYQALSDQVYRFLPILVTVEDLDRFHGSDERIEVGAYARAIAFYVRLLERAAGEGA